MTATLDPLTTLTLWADHPEYPTLHRMLHPAYNEAQMWLVGDITDDLVCMATLISLARRTDIYVGVDDARTADVLARCNAVADTCGRDMLTMSTDECIVLRFSSRKVAA